ncbi:3-ketosteroid-9-alpha-monooxygenase, ferredoxin reductase component [Emticicia aquatica]|jgi:ring-1,2-phenylacetyl-CoA epoxidase subunit PaaE|uniref:3-ketosteroid-9-alpha-monooxygenase, ferredoxin reductase component n=1 Tax=Emticicia aquatica TaxID=1681835 RepID=A0ABM9AS57_9BACT|nr:ferredoxin--NADP reductase [Emticicia aquatica]CAH0996524.1 3-ketosteroid-9-alpha-monooxygenase, ferredoxin reductase component [Emticicia aquatica]
MSLKTYFLQVKEVVQETSDSVTIYFWHPLSEQIKYKAGQFITVIVPAGEAGKKVRRSYSMSTSPHSDTSIGITVKRVTGGLVSNYLNDNVKVGDFLEVLEPMGNFHVEPNADKTRHVVLFAAGSGVTPMMSIAKSILKMEQNSRVTLIYGNRREDSIIFKHKLEELETQYGRRLSVHHLLSNPSDLWVGHKGRISQGIAIRLMKESDTDFAKDEFYLCGPIGMMEDVMNGLGIYNVSKDRIHKENFHTAMVEGEPEEIDESLQTQTVKVKYNGNEYDFEVKPHQTILEAALDLDIDLPYSCQAGMCTACMGTCTEGKIKMDEEDGLTEKEIKRGLMLTCVAHPLSKGVVIEID